MRWNKNKHEFPAFDLENICQSPGINFRRLETIKLQAILGFVESLQSHMIFTMSHWSSGLTCLLPAIRVTGSNPLGGTYAKPGFSC
jgi:hypothetical protein